MNPSATPLPSGVWRGREGIVRQCVTHWICEARKNDHVIDVIFGSSNGICTVDAKWFSEAPQVTLLREAVHLVSVEEMNWSRAFVMDREGYEEADIAYLLHGCSQRFDW